MDWRTSQAHRKLLAKFRWPQTSESLINDYLRDQLGESVERAVDRFRDEGLICDCTLEETLSATHGGPELKELCRERNLKLSGKKAQVIERLVAADRLGMQQLVSTCSHLKLSASGQSVVKEILTEDEERQQAKTNAILEAIRQHDFRKARILTEEFHSIEDEVLNLEEIFRVRPKILSSVSDEALFHLRVAAAYHCLTSHYDMTVGLPERLQLGLRMENDCAARMIIFYIWQRHNLAQMAKYPEWRVRLSYGSDEHVCPECKRAATKLYHPQDAPELPLPECTCEFGCGCVYVADEKSILDSLSR